MRPTKHHIIYKTTCLVTGRFYIGLHSTDDLDDGYLGSGLRLAHSLQKHGAEQHTRIILEHCSSREELKRREAEIVNERLLQDERCMNIALGGGEGWEQVNANRSAEEWASIQKLGYAAMTAKLTPEQRSFRARNGWQGTEKQMAAFKSGQPLATIAAASPEVNKRRKATLQSIGHQQGNANSQYGKCWMTNGEKNLKASASDVERLLAEGYRRGRVTCAHLKNMEA